MIQDLRTMVDAAVEALGDVRPAPADAVRYELFHAANSICSQKVRVVLAELGQPYTARSVNIFTGQTYLPDYVRLRMAGCRALGAPLAEVHSGSTSVRTSGCDAAVVPTLIDWRTGEVVVDSKRICLHIDASAPDGARLRPPRLAEAIDAELAIVDDLPNYQMLMGRPPGGGDTPVTRKGGGGPAFALSKVERCRRYLEDFADDPVLTQAYRAKLEKELSAADALFSEAAMEHAYNKASAACTGLDHRLGAVDGPWLFGERVTLADLFWGLELIRMENLGADGLWERRDLKRVSVFLRRIKALPSIREAVLDWPGALF